MVAVGGGKCIDTGKVMAFQLGCACVIVPTLASNDAPCSALSILYDVKGAFRNVAYFPNNPYDGDGNWDGMGIAMEMEMVMAIAKKIGMGMGMGQ